ncbi:MAG: T9SS type A sorting domain-containing protein [Bacteroidota bacterium]
MKFSSFFFFLAALLLGGSSFAQDVTFSLQNPQITNGGANYEADIYVSSNTGFKMGSGQLYLNYNEQAFGPNVQANGKFVYLQPPGSILGTLVGNPPFQFAFYQDFIVNDNITDRVSISWQHAFSEACLGANNVTSTSTFLAHVSFTFLPGASSLDPELCFESANLFVNQTFTACGPPTCGNVNCFANPGTQLTNDAYDCSALLPVTLLQFGVHEQVDDAHLTWQTGQETGSSHFVVEKSTNGHQWQYLGRVAAAGDSYTLRKYRFTDYRFRENFAGVSTFYYRLRMVDLDESFAYSDIEKVQVSSTIQSDISVYPNPSAPATQCQVTVTGATNTDWTCQVLDAQGRSINTVINVAHVTAATLTWQINDLSPGVYWIRTQTVDGRQLLTRRLVVQR